MTNHLCNKKNKLKYIPRIITEVTNHAAVKANKISALSLPICVAGAPDTPSHPPHTPLTPPALIQQTHLIEQSKSKVVHILPTNIQFIYLSASLTPNKIDIYYHMRRFRDEKAAKQKRNIHNLYILA